MTTSTQAAHDAVFAAGKATPPLAVSGMTAVGFDLQTWVLIATLLYTLLQAGVLIYNFVKNYRADREDKGK